MNYPFQEAWESYDELRNREKIDMPMSADEESKVQKLLDLLEEQGVVIKRMALTCEALEKILRERINAS